MRRRARQAILHSAARTPPLSRAPATHRLQGGAASRSCGNGVSHLNFKYTFYIHENRFKENVDCRDLCKRAGAHACDLLPLCAFKLRPLLKNGKCWQNENSDSKSGFDQTLHARKDSEIERSYATCGLTPFSPVRTLNGCSRFSARLHTLVHVIYHHVSVAGRHFGTSSQ